MADKTTSAITAADALTGAEILYLIQGGNSRRTTANDLAALATAGVDVSGLVAKNAAAFAAEVTVASASTADVLGAASLFVVVTGTTTITSLGTGTNRIRVVRFTGALILTHNATTLVLPSGANITTAAGDVMILESDGSSNVRVVNYMRASGKALVPPTPAEAGAAAVSQTGEPFYGVILGALSDRDYRIVLKAAHGGTITETVTRSVSGTATATFKVNTTALGGTANSVSSTENAQTHASSNTFVAGDDIVITISANASCVDMSFSIKYTRTLS